MPELAGFARQRLSQKAAPETHPDSCMLTGFLENALPPRLRTEVTEHLGYCVDCRGILRLAQSQQQPAVAPQLVVERPRPQLWSILRWASVVATTAVVAGTVWLAQVPKAIVGSSNSAEPAKIASASAPAKPPLAQPENSSYISSTNTVVKPTTRKHRTEVAASKTPAIEPSLEMIQTGLAVDSGSGSGSEAKFDPRTADMVPPSATTASPKDSNTRWMIGPTTGLVYQSSDGKSWQSVNIKRGTAFNAVATSGDTIWAGGKQGQLYRSSDSGKTWEQVKPWGETNAGDIEQIQFRDSQSGSIKTSSGATWITRDAGNTWQKQ